MRGNAERKGVIILGGGVGPMAGVKLHEKIIAYTETDGSDQDHIDVVHISRASLIRDRTRFLMGEEKENPGRTMGRLVAALAGVTTDGMGFVKDAGESGPLCAGVPCNTFHAPPVWTAYLEELAKAAPSLNPVHMLDTCLQELREALSGAAQVGILATTGTARSGVWREKLESGGFLPLEVDDALQQDVHRAIYDPSWGLKAETPPSLKAVSIMKGAVRRLIDRGARAIILGCTEIPLALEEGVVDGVLQIDPVSSLARELIRTAGGRVKEVQ